MSCTSPNTVASTTTPLLTPSLRSRNCSRCATAFFITSADCSTNGRISSPEPNLSPTSFIAGSSTLLSTSTGSRFSSASSIFASIPSLRRRRIALWMRTSTGASASSSTCAAAPFADTVCDSKCSITRCSASGRRLSTRSSHSSRSTAPISAYGVISAALTIAMSSPASVQWCSITELSTCRAAGLSPNDTLETPSDVSTPGQLALDEADAFDRLDGRVDVLRVAGRQREREVVEDQRAVGDAVLVDDDVADALGDLQLALRGLRHPRLVDRQRDDRRARFFHQRHHRVDLHAAVLEVDRVDHRAARVDLQRGFDHLGFGGVDDQRRFDRLREALDDRRHLHVFVGALGERGADVEQVRAAFDLAARDERDLVVVVGEQQPFDLARALAVDALADQQDGAVLLERDGGHRGRGELQRLGRGHARRVARRRERVEPGAERGDVRGRRAAAAADRVHAEVFDERAELRRHLGGRLRIDRLAFGAHVRQARVGDDAHEAARVLDEKANRVAHVRRARSSSSGRSRRSAARRASRTPR